MAFDRFFKVGLLVVLVALALVLGFRRMDRVDAQPAGNAMIGRYQFAGHDSRFVLRWYVIDSCTGQIFQVNEKGRTAEELAHGNENANILALTTPMP